MSRSALSRTLSESDISLQLEMALQSIPFTRCPMVWPLRSTLERTSQLKPVAASIAQLSTMTASLEQVLSLEPVPESSAEPFSCQTLSCHQGGSFPQVRSGAATLLPTFVTSLSRSSMKTTWHRTLMEQARAPLMPSRSTRATSSTTACPLAKIQSQIMLRKSTLQTLSSERRRKGWVGFQAALIVQIPAICIAVHI